MGTEAKSLDEDLRIGLEAYFSKGKSPDGLTLLVYDINTGNTKADLFLPRDRAEALGTAILNTFKERRNDRS